MQIERRNRSLPFAAVLLLSFVAGCDRSAQLERRHPEDISAAKIYFNSLRDAHYEIVLNDFDPIIKDRNNFRPEFDELVATVPKENPISVNPKWIKVDCNSGTCVHHIVLEYRYTNELLLSNVVIRKTGALSSVLGMHFQIIPESAIAASEFRLSNKGFPQFAILLMAILFPLFSLYVLVLCVRAKIGPQKWIWAVLILFGVSRLGVNWATGQPDFELFAIQFLSAAASSETYGPWTVSISLPLGAILFLLNHAIRARHDEATQTGEGQAHI